MNTTITEVIFVYTVTFVPLLGGYRRVAGVISTQYNVDMPKKTDKENEGTTALSVRLPNALLAQIDRIVTDERRTRGNVVRILLEDALKAREEK